MSAPIATVRGSLIPLLASLVVAVAGCGGGGGGGAITPPGGGGGGGGGGGPVLTNSVNMSGNAFAPPDIQVSPGSTVTFANLDGIAHNVTFTSAGATGIGNFSNGSQSLVAPSVAGTYSFHCTNHAGMNGSIKVQ